MVKSTVTSKWQITVPFEIRNFLELEKGDSLLFDIIDVDNKIVHVTKENSHIECPVCVGRGMFEEFNLPCFVCDQKGYITEKIDMVPFIFSIANKQYKVGVGFYQEELKDKVFKMFFIPQILLTSSIYPKPLLVKIQDVLQTMVIKETVLAKLYGPIKPNLSSDAFLEEILELLISEEAKMEIKHWLQDNDFNM